MKTFLSNDQTTFENNTCGTRLRSNRMALSAVKIGAVALLCFACLASTSQAILIPNLYNTGVDAFGNALPPPTGNSVDPHYKIIASPSGPLPAVTVDETLFPIASGPWVPNSPGSRWIGPSSTFGLGPAGSYVYRTQFSLPSNATQVIILGLWGTDDPSVDIFLNGFAQAQTSAGFTSLVPFVVTGSGAQINPGGVNFLDFQLINAGGPTGLRIEALCGHYYVPEPGGATCAGLLLGVVTMVRRNVWRLLKTLQPAKLRRLSKPVATA
jgi:hypothetical protein